MKHLPLYFVLFCMALATSLVFTAQANAQTSKLLIHITGFESSEGVAKVGVFNSKKGYEDDVRFKGFNFNIIDNKVEQTIELPYGEYAIKVYHDENSNDELDTMLFGIPSEDYGFSNNARGSMGPPEYEQVVFKLDSAQKEITINVQ